jgi:high affinity sulfate transporter 1
MALFAGLRPLRREGVLRDVLAGLVLASMNIPQVLGYTRIAGMPVVTGLYTVLAPLVAFAAFGSSRHLVVAADSATAAVFSSGLAGMAARGSEHYVMLVGAVALMVAAMLLVARVFRLGFLADFLSRTVLVGFLAGVGVQIAIAMLGGMLGVDITTARTPAQVLELWERRGETHLPTLAVAAVVAVTLLLAKRFVPRWPVPLVVVLGGMAASFGWDFAARGIAVVGPVPGGLPALTLPVADWRVMLDLAPIAASCVVIIIAQSAATARAFALPRRERVDGDADILGLAAANAGAALTGTFVVNGSPTQTAMAARAGAESQVAQLAFAALVAVVLLFFTGPLQYLPHAVLAALVFTVGVGMIDVPALAAMRRESRGETALAAVTAITVVVAGVKDGILLAVALSLLRHVRHSYRPHTAVLAPGADGRWAPEPASPGEETEPGLLVYRFGADLFYANDNRFADEVRELVARAPHPVRTLVVDASAITDIDYSAARTVRDLCAELVTKGVRVVFARVSPFLKNDMDRHGITAAIGANNMFPTLHEAVDAVRRGSVTEDTPQRPSEAG